MVCNHHSVTDLKPTFCVQSSIEPVNVIRNAFINEMKISYSKQLSQVNLLGIFISNDLFLGEYCKSMGLSKKT